LNDPTGNRGVAEAGPVSVQEVIDQAEERSLETDEEEEDEGLHEHGALDTNKLMLVPPDFERAMVHQVSDDDC
jgi:hypothetical protein